MATDFVSMAAKMSNIGDIMSKANLQADGLVGKPAQGAADQWEMEEEDSSPHNSPTWSTCPEAAYRPSQYELLFGNTSDFNR